MESAEAVAEAPDLLCPCCGSATKKLFPLAAFNSTFKLCWICYLDFSRSQTPPEERFKGARTIAGLEPFERNDLPPAPFRLLNEVIKKAFPDKDYPDEALFAFDICYETWYRANKSQPHRFDSLEKLLDNRDCNISRSFLGGAAYNRAKDTVKSKSVRDHALVFVAGIVTVGYVEYIDPEPNPKLKLPPNWTPAKGLQELVEHGDFSQPALDFARYILHGEIDLKAEEDRGEFNRRLREALEGKTPKLSKTKKENSAMVVLTEHPDWSNTQIAEKVPCNANYLSHCKRFKKLRNSLRQQGRIPRGWKDKETGAVEAVDESEFAE